MEENSHKLAEGTYWKEQLGRGISLKDAEGYFEHVRYVLERAENDLVLMIADMTTDDEKIKEQTQFVQAMREEVAGYEGIVEQLREIEKGKLKNKKT
jgi:C4-type Zn-finger protein